MSREEKIDKIIEMSKEIVYLLDISDEEIDKMYIQTKIMLEILKN